MCCQIWSLGIWQGRVCRKHSRRVLHLTRSFTSWNPMHISMRDSTKWSEPRKDCLAYNRWTTSHRNHSSRWVKESGGKMKSRSPYQSCLGWAQPSPPPYSVGCKVQRVEEHKDSRQLEEATVPKTMFLPMWSSRSDCGRVNSIASRPFLG